MKTRVLYFILLFLLFAECLKAQGNYQNIYSIPMGMVSVNIPPPQGNGEPGLIYCSGNTTDTTGVYWLAFAICDSSEYTIVVNVTTQSLEPAKGTLWGPFSDSVDARTSLYSASPECFVYTLTSGLGWYQQLGEGYYVLMVNPPDSTTMTYVTLLNNIQHNCNVCNSPVSMDQNICLITTDSALQRNRIIWNKGDTTQIAGYEIQRENSIANQFDSLTFVSVDSLSEYLDMSANPAVKSWRYRISRLTRCNQRWFYSMTPAETIHLQQTISTGNSINLTWNQATPGASFIPSFFIYRGDGTNPLQILDSVAFTTTSYSDLNPMPGINVYQIRRRVAYPCDINYTESVSNLKSSVFTGVDETLGTEFFTLGPNPSQGVIHLSVYVPNNGYEVTLFDDAGRLLQNQNGSGTGNMIINTENYAMSYVIAQLTLNGKTYFRKLVIANK